MFVLTWKSIRIFVLRNDVQSSLTSRPWYNVIRYIQIDQSFTGSHCNEPSCWSGDVEQIRYGSINNNKIVMEILSIYRNMKYEFCIILIWKIYESWSKIVCLPLYWQHNVKLILITNNSCFTCKGLDSPSSAEPPSAASLHCTLVVPQIHFRD